MEIDELSLLFLFTVYIHLCLISLLIDLIALATVSNVTSPLTQQSSAQAKSAIGVLRSHGSKEWLKSSPYLVLLDDFLSAVALSPRGGQSPGKFECFDKGHQCLIFTSVYFMFFLASNITIFTIVFISSFIL
jgi:hypothetical protein